MTESRPAHAASGGGGMALYLAFLQLVFTLLWTVYVVYLPKLAAQVGIAPASVLLILMLDQAIFTVADTAMGIMADRLAPVVGRLGIAVGIVSVLSCLAFVALPFVAGLGAGAQVWFVALIVIWAVTSSALRAPPLALLGKYGARPKLPVFAALVMLGYGLAGAASPYLGLVLRDVDARLPFILSTGVLLATALALSRVEYGLASKPVERAPAAKPLGAPAILFIAATVLLALGFQLHFSINSAPLYLKFAKPPELPWLMPVFWIGFNLALLPAGLLAKRSGALVLMGVAALLGACAIVLAERAPDLHILMASQALAGAAWACMLLGAITAALEIGHTGAEGKVSGLVFSGLALAAFARIATVHAGLQKMPDYAPLLQWMPVVCWTLGGICLLLLAATTARDALTASRGG